MTSAGPPAPVRWARTASADPAWRVAATAGALSLVLLGWWVLRSPFVGLADNGDWGRYGCPVGLSSRSTAVDLPTRIPAGSCPAFDYRSSFVPFLWLARRLGPGDGVDLRHLAAFWSVVASASWAWLGFELARSWDRAGRALAVVVVAVVVASDTGFTGYYASLYGEALVLALLPALGAALVRLGRVPRLRARLVAGAAVPVVLVTVAKPSLALVAPLFAGTVWLVRGGRPRSPVLAATGAVAVLAVSLFSTAAVSDPAFRDWNTYNVTFTALLPSADDPAAVLRDLGMSAEHADDLTSLVGVPFSEPVTDRWDEPALREFRALPRSAPVVAIARRPAVVRSMVGEAVGQLDGLHLDYLSTASGTGRAEGQVVRADRPEPAQLVLVPLAAGGPVTVAAWVLATGAALATVVRRRRRAASAAAVGLAAATLLLGGTQVLTALADGYYELAKHLVVADAALATGVAGLLAAGAFDLVDHLAGRRFGPQRVGIEARRADPTSPVPPS